MDSKSIALICQNGPVNEIHNTNENFPNADPFALRHDKLLQIESNLAHAGLDSDFRDSCTALHKTVQLPDGHKNWSRHVVVNKEYYCDLC